MYYDYNPIVLQCPSPKVRKKYKNHCTLAKIVKTASMTVIFEKSKSLENLQILSNMVSFVFQVASD